MKEKLSIDIIRIRYHAVMIEIYDCIARKDTQRALVIRIKLIKLFIDFTSMKGSKEITDMKACLNLMGNKLLTIPSSHGSN